MLCKSIIQKHFCKVLNHTDLYTKLYGSVQAYQEKSLYEISFFSAWFTISVHCSSMVNKVNCTANCMVSKVKFTAKTVLQNVQVGYLGKLQIRRGMCSELHSLMCGSVVHFCEPMLYLELFTNISKFDDRF